TEGSRALDHRGGSYRIAGSLYRTWARCAVGANSKARGNASSNSQGCRASGIGRISSCLLFTRVRRDGICPPDWPSWISAQRAAVSCLPWTMRDPDSLGQLGRGASIPHIRPQILLRQLHRNPAPLGVVLDLVLADAGDAEILRLGMGEVVARHRRDRD